jgi:hypothetical protein
MMDKQSLNQVESLISLLAAKERQTASLLSALLRPSTTVSASVVRSTIQQSRTMDALPSRGSAALTVLAAALVKSTKITMRISPLDMISGWYD